MVSFAEDLKDIKLAVSDSLHEINKRENLQGWVKADETDFSSISEELARLSKENSELKLELANYQNSGEKVNGVEIEKFARLLYYKKTKYEYFTDDGIKINNLLIFFHFYQLLSHSLEYSFDMSYDYRLLRNYGLVNDNHTHTDNGSKLLTFLDFNKEYLSDFLEERNNE